jgi:hypothetical protein
MNLAELKAGCREYERTTAYDASLRTLRQLTGRTVDPFRHDHRMALFEWLNAWGCRQFALAHHATTASGSLVGWADVWFGRLPSPAALLTDLEPDQLASCVGAYDALWQLQASYRKLAGGRLVAVAFGPTGAAKTLFAIRPNVFPPWDDPIREQLGYNGNGLSFRSYLMSVAEQLRSLALEAQTSVGGLPFVVGRPESSAPKLIDEANWVTITRA